jgi:hypothetical protein
MDGDTNQLELNMASVIIVKYCSNKEKGDVQFCFASIG